LNYSSYWHKWKWSKTVIWTLGPFAIAVMKDLTMWKTSINISKYKLIIVLKNHKYWIVYDRAVIKFGISLLTLEYSHLFFNLFWNFVFFFLIYPMYFYFLANFDFLFATSSQIFVINPHNHKEGWKFFLVILYILSV